MLATVASSVVQGVDGHPVSVEVHVSNGLPGYTLVGLPDASCRESRDRVRAAILSSGLRWPARRVTINLAPTGLRKHGASLDLPIALGILAASDQIPAEALRRFGAIGELGLDGSVRSVSALVSLADAVAAPEVFVPVAAGDQAAVVRPGEVRPIATLGEVVAGLTDAAPLPPVHTADTGADLVATTADLAEVRGQPLARWALEVAAAGGHHLLMVGPPGAGKTMLAARLAGLLPPLDGERALATTRVHSAAGLPIPGGGLVRLPPYRAPHHGASMVAMIGGGSAAMRPGEISCSHNGVLFLDELGEFSVAVLDALRQPLEEGVVRISRAARAITLPANFQLVAAMNPCPCGEGSADGSCRCSDHARSRYARRLSGPLLDRFDLRVEVSPPAPDVLMGNTVEEDSASVAARVSAVRGLAAQRGVRCNAELPPADLAEVAPLTPAAVDHLRSELQRGSLTGRGLRRVRTVARTIADLQGVDGPIGVAVVQAALGLRSTPRSVLGVAA
ncbi:MAG: YifB family Mg chelatase-like AAA ATPase [Actinomycetota bacterium]